MLFVLPEVQHLIREDLIGHAKDSVPAMLNYKTFADSDSMYNTPPTFGIYIAGLVFRHVLENGGLNQMKDYNEEKAAILYKALDESKLFHPTADPAHRSLMNVTFTLPTKELDADFVSAASKAGFVNLKGHRLVGGMRASIYNAMPIEGVRALASFIRQYEEDHQ
jgi:phosphoserine aminotransferase